MTELEEMWKIQKDFQKHFFDIDTLTDDDKIRLTKEFILCMHRELGEALNELPWKLHRKNEETYDVENVREELIDCFKYLLNVCIIHGMTPQSFTDYFMAKSIKVEKRYTDENI